MQTSVVSVLSLSLALLACGGRANDPDAVDTALDAPRVVIAPRPPSGTTPGAADAPPESASGASSEVPVEAPDPSGPTEPRQTPGALLGRFCGTCHGGEAILAGNVQGRIDYIEDVDRLVEEGWIVPLSSDDSPLVQLMAAGEMPPPGVEPRPTTAEILVLRGFIDTPRFWPTP